MGLQCDCVSELRILVDYCLFANINFMFISAHSRAVVVDVLPFLDLGADTASTVSVQQKSGTDGLFVKTSF